MDNIRFCQVSSLEKVYLDYVFPDTEHTSMSAMKNERISYQIAYTGLVPYMRQDVKVSIESPLKHFITVRRVGNVPTERPIRMNSDNYYERYAPGLFPDVLYPMDDDAVEILYGNTYSLWITVELDGSVEGGVYPIDIVFSDIHGSVRKRMELQVIPAMLPPQKLIFTQWFYADCIADYYKISVFSEKHWELIDKFLIMAAQNGINMILTPVFTPALDTAVGGERTTVQLVGIEKRAGKYLFDFSKLHRWISLCKKNGIQYLEIVPLFSQWGAEFTPKIIVTEEGEEKQLFGWHVKSLSTEYQDFLSQFLPALKEELDKAGMTKYTYFHISDEPSGEEEHQERYKKLKDMVGPYLKGFKVIDALSSYSFYEKGIVEHPVPSSDHIDDFIEANVPDLWTYYCCSQETEVSNRFMAMPSYRNRVIGLQFYKFDIKGFLHWGYNFYSSALSKQKINPFLVTDAINTYPAGDAFSVYPYVEGPIESLRIVVFHDALQDVRALELLESYIGRKKVVEMIEKEAGMEISFKQYPHNSQFLLNLRSKVNEAIKEEQNKRSKRS